MGPVGRVSRPTTTGPAGNQAPNAAAQRAAVTASRPSPITPRTPDTLTRSNVLRPFPSTKKPQAGRVWPEDDHSLTADLSKLNTPLDELMLMNSTDTRQAGPQLSTDGNDVIDPGIAKNLYGLLRQRRLRSPEHCAYRQYNKETKEWQDTNWRELEEQVARWHTGLANEGLRAGDRVAICMHNCIEWVTYELAAQSLGLVTISIYPNDRADNMAYILEDSGARILLVERFQQWKRVKSDKN